MTSLNPLRTLYWVVTIIVATLAYPFPVEWREYAGFISLVLIAVGFILVGPARNQEEEE